MELDTFLDTLYRIASVYNTDPEEGDNLVESLIDVLVMRRNKFIDRTGDINDIIVKLNVRDFNGAVNLYTNYLEKRHESGK